MATSSNTSNLDQPVGRRGMKVLLWTLQVLLAALFAFAGVMKFIMPVDMMVKQSGFSAAFLHFIGVVEVLGALGLILPALLGILPVLTPIAAVGLVIIMIGATVVTLPMGPGAAFPAVVGLLTAFVAYGRFRLAPVRPR